MMEKTEFDQRVKLAKMQGAQVQAARLVLVDGVTKYAAAQETGVNEAQVGRAVKKLSREICECCGQFVEKKL